MTTPIENEVSIPDINSCEVVFIPNRNTPFLLFPDDEPMKETIQAFMESFNISFNEITFIHGEQKELYYNTFKRAHEEGKVNWSNRIERV